MPDRARKGFLLMRHDARRTLLIGTFLILAPGFGYAVAQEKPPAPALAPDRLLAIDRISSDSLKGHLSFLASDLLEGRDTPSRGLDLAAEYIAAQFRRAGLEAIGDDGYFQTANWEVSEPDPAGPRLELIGAGKSTIADKDQLSVTRSGPIDVTPSESYKLVYQDGMELDFAAVTGRVVFLEAPQAEPVQKSITAYRLFLGKLTGSKAALIVIISRVTPVSPIPARNLTRLIDPKGPAQPARPEMMAVPNVNVSDPRIIALFDAFPVGPSPMTASFQVPAPVRRPVKIRNVVGLLRGSDPVLKDTCVMVTAHYDHLGVNGPAGTDRIYNGANDDGSGTVSVIELATSLATLKERPKRSILFATFFGEEKGLLGSRYYGRNPVFPIDKTIADVNLEQVGRTDSTEGPQILKGSLTGFGYSEVSTAFVNAGEAEGVQVVKHPRNSDLFFGRSDNQALADLGVPAHTLCVAFQFADYHGAADHWDKVDYNNMARIDRMVARALLSLADNPSEPHWDESNPRATRYLKAWKDRQGK